MQKMFAAVKSLTVLKPIIFHGIMLCFPTRNPVFSQTVYDLKIVAAIALVVDVDLSVYVFLGCYSRIQCLSLDLKNR